MVAAVTLLSYAMTTATTALISSAYNKDWRQQHSENKLTKSTNMINNIEENEQQQNNNKTVVEEIDCSALLDSYEGETSNNSSDFKLFRWTPESTRLMLKLRFERQVEFQLRHRQKKDLWSEIANEMRKEGNFYTTGEVCDLKYRNMLQTYKKNYLKEERGMQSQIVWEYYEVFKEAMKACAAVVDDLVPSQLCDTICENNDVLLDEVKREEELHDEEDLADCEESNYQRRDKEIAINEDEAQMKTINRAIKRRAPSARVHANNNKRLQSVNAKFDAVTNNEFDWSHLPPLEPKPDTVAVTTTTISPSQAPTNMAQPQLFQPVHNIYPLAPPWLTDSELREYFSYGESVGLQIAHIRDPRTRAFLQLKIQETLFLAKEGKLTS